MEKRTPDHVSRGRLLLVDDEPDILSAMRALLQRRLKNVDVVTATSGREALEALKVAPVDGIITDYRMPGMDGLEFLGRAGRLCPDVETVMATAYPDLHLAVEALNEHHISHFLVKPLDPTKLVEVAGRIVWDAQRERMRRAALDHATEIARRVAGK